MKQQKVFFDLNNLHMFVHELGSKGGYKLIQATLLYKVPDQDKKDDS